VTLDAKVTDTMNGIYYDGFDVYQPQFQQAIKVFFEDGDLIASLIGTGFVPYASQLAIELHMSPEDYSLTVRMLFNWEEVPLPGVCLRQTRCDYYTFQLMIQELIFTDSEFTLACGPSPKQAFQSKVNDFKASLNEPKVVSKSQLLRVL
jgi:hypothetical protein